MSSTHDQPAFAATAATVDTAAADTAAVDTAAADASDAAEILSTGAGPSRLARLRAQLSPKEWSHLIAMGAFVLGLNVLGWFTVIALVAPNHYSLGHDDHGVPQVFGIGTGVTAYLYGMRHAFDADHISAIDNTTRKLMSDGKRPLSVGFWFSLGHSSVVFALSLLLSLGVRALVGPVRNDDSSLHHYTGLIGTSVSGGFLYVIAILNVVVLYGILKVFRAMRRGEFDEATLEHHLNHRGFMNRIFGGLMKSITKPWQMYPVGVLFGLGFDTATEVALLVLASTSAAFGLPWYAILCLPVLFAAGMTLFDTLDGSFMNFAYGWAFFQPVRKVFYNIAITGLSVAVALVIGTIELLQVLQGQLNLGGSFWTWIAGFNLNTVGFVIVGLFVGTWLAAVLIWRFGRIEEKWTAHLRPASRQR
jgi:high-affinity nickel-transport protein